MIENFHANVLKNHTFLVIKICELDTPTAKIKHKQHILIIDISKTRSSAMATLGPPEEIQTALERLEFYHHVYNKLSNVYRSCTDGKNWSLEEASSTDGIER